MKNKLIVIGCMGVKTAYLNVPRDEAIRRYAVADLNPGEDLEERIKEINSGKAERVSETDFDDEFSTYNA